MKVLLWFLVGGLCFALAVDRGARLIATLSGLLRLLLGSSWEGEVVETIPLAESDLVSGTAGVMRPVSFVVPVVGDVDVQRLRRTVESVAAISHPRVELLMVATSESAAALFARLPPTLRPDSSIEPLADRRLVGAGDIESEAPVPGRPRLRWLTTRTSNEEVRHRACALNVGVNAARYSLLMELPVGSTITDEGLRHLVRGVLLSGSVAGTVARTRQVDGSWLCRAVLNLRSLRQIATPNSDLEGCSLAPNLAVLWRKQTLIAVGGADETRDDWREHLRDRLARHLVDHQPSRLVQFGRITVVHQMAVPAGPARQFWNLTGSRAADCVPRTAVQWLCAWCELAALLALVFGSMAALIGRPEPRGLVLLGCLATGLWVLPLLLDVVLILGERLVWPAAAKSEVSEPSPLALLSAASLDAIVLRTFSCVFAIAGGLRTRRRKLARAR